jgi:hypothetical protein
MSAGSPLAGADWQANLARLIDIFTGLSTGFPPSPQMPFYRIGEPVVIPVSPDSADEPFEMVVPDKATSFQFTNRNPFAVRLRGTKVGQPFVQVTPTTGWLWLPGTQGIRSTVRPALVSVMSVDGPYGATSTEQRAGSGFIELQYGMGLPG